MKHIEKIKEISLHKLLFFIFCFTLPFQLRILFNAEQAYIEDYFSFHEAIFFYFTDIVFLACFIDWLIFGNKSASNNALLIRILAYLSLILITLFHVKHLYLGIYQSVKWFEMFAILVYSWMALNRRDVPVVLALVFGSSILQSILALAQFHMKHGLNLRVLGEYIAPLGTPGLSTIDVAGEKLIRAYGTFPHPNVLAGFLVFGLISGFYYVSRETSRYIWLVSCGTLIVTIGLFVSFSRMGWIAAILAYLGFILFHVFAKDYRKGFIIGGLLLVSCGTIAVLYSDLALSRGSESLTSQAIVLRSDFNQMGLEIIKKYPAIGVGVGNYIEALKDLYDLLPWQHQPPHNIYIYIGAELGLLGLLLFLTIIFTIIGSTWNQKSNILGFTLLLSVFVILLMGLFDHYWITIQQGRLTFFLALGLVAAIGRSEN